MAHRKWLTTVTVALLAITPIAGTAYAFSNSFLGFSPTAPTGPSRVVGGPGFEQATAVFATHMVNGQAALVPGNPGVPTFFNGLVGTQRAANGQWSLVSLNGANIDSANSFQLVGFKAGDPDNFTVTVTATNHQGHTIAMDHGKLNGSPRAGCHVMPVAGAVNNPHRIGVYYANNRWTIYNEDMQPLPNGAQFQVRVSDQASITVTVPPNHRLPVFPLAALPPTIKNNAAAKLLVTHNWNPNGVGNVYFDRPVGVVFIVGAGWALQEENRQPFPDNVSFNVDWDLAQGVGAR